MDRVRFGRALGYGARHAAKTMMAAAEAATAPDPARPRDPNLPPRRPEILPPVNTARVAETVSAVRRGAGNAKAASGGMTAPIRRFSAVLWLEVTGAFFAVMATTFAGACWRYRAAFTGGATPDLRHRAWLFAVLLVVFGYFAVSSFARARSRGRR